MKFIVLFAAIIGVVVCQRPYYAGRRPIGYGETANRFMTEAPATDEGALVNRVGDGDPVATGTTGINNGIGGANRTTVAGTNGTAAAPTTTERLPVDALGDRELIDRISKWPVDKQPYWYINWRHIEAQRQRPVVPQGDYRPSFFQSQQGRQWNNPQNTNPINTNQA